MFINTSSIVANPEPAAFAILGCAIRSHSNVVVVFAIYVIELTILQQRERKMMLTYEKIENIHFESDEAFLADLKERLGINVTRYEIAKVNYLRDSADIVVYYTVDEKK